MAWLLILASVRPRVFVSRIYLTSSGGGVLSVWAALENTATPSTIETAAGADINRNTLLITDLSRKHTIIPGSTFKAKRSQVYVAVHGPSESQTVGSLLNVWYVAQPCAPEQLLFCIDRTGLTPGNWTQKRCKYGLGV